MMQEGKNIVLRKKMWVFLYCSPLSFATPYLFIYLYFKIHALLCLPVIYIVFSSKLWMYVHLMNSLVRRDSFYVYHGRGYEFTKLIV